jgi:hypothetical protein
MIRFLTEGESVFSNTVTTQPLLALLFDDVIAIDQTIINIFPAIQPPAIDLRGLVRATCYINQKRDSRTRFWASFLPLLVIKFFMGPFGFCIVLKTFSAVNV